MHAAQVLCIQLEPGHTHTDMCLAALPCTSAKQLAGSHTAPTAKQFAVVASYMEDSSSGLMRLQGLLNVFEVCASSGREHQAGWVASTSIWLLLALGQLIKR